MSGARRWCCGLMVAVAAGVLALPAGASANWTRPVTVIGEGYQQGAELQNDGALRVWWEFDGTYRNPPPTGVQLATRGGRVQAAPRTALDRHTIFDWYSVRPAYEDPAYLADGRSIKCSVYVSNDGSRAWIRLLVYSPKGALTKTLLVAQQPVLTTNFGPDCQVAAAGDQAVVEFTQTGQSPSRNNVERQIYIARLLPGPSVSAPIPVLAPGPDQQALGTHAPNDQVSVSPTGWVAVAWGWGDRTHTNVHNDTVSESWQYLMAWISPQGTVGPAIPLGAVQSGENCTFDSPKCGLGPSGPVVSVVGDQRAAATFGWPHLSSETIDSAGNVSALTVASQKVAFQYPYLLNGSQVESGGGRVLVAWGGGCRTAAVWAASWWRGRWTAPVKLAAATASTCLGNVTAEVNDRGQASVTWGRFPTRPSLDITTYAAFDF